MPKRANLTVAEIKSALTKEGISYPAWAKVVVVVNLSFTSLFCTKGLSSDIIIR